MFIISFINYIASYHFANINGVIRNLLVYLVVDISFKSVYTYVVSRHIR